MLAAYPGARRGSVQMNVSWQILQCMFVFLLRRASPMDCMAEAFHRLVVSSKAFGTYLGNNGVAHLGCAVTSSETS